MLSTLFRTVFVHIPKTGGQSVLQVFLRQHGLNWETRAALLLRPNDDPSRGPPRLTHLFAREYVECGHVDAERFAAFFKFTIVRNPYDRLMSEYRYRYPTGATTLREFLARLDEGTPGQLRHTVPQAEFVLDARGQVMVDRILRFETLAAEIEPVFRQLFGCAVTLPHANRSAGPRIDHRSLDADVRHAIRRRYEVDFDTFWYCI